MLSPIGLLVFSNRHLFQLTQDHKGLYKAFIGLYDTTSRNYSATRRLLHFIANLNFPSRLSTLEQKAISRPIDDSPTRLDDTHAFSSSFFLAALLLLAK
ncbi:hypothetical protein H5410_003831 [Solanum commersonii]|uniref:Uncharacterized protein n=1 Tax=Solanum commersonii TaxID=4109 RepID=A0A9J6B681_SOLCO|nr:hypothetical protein H5410_003831 [Solanum commersonii]